MSSETEKDTIELTDGNPGRGCQICGANVETRFGGCFTCVDAESVIATGENMCNETVATTPMEKLKYILNAYRVHYKNER